MHCTGLMSSILNSTTFTNKLFYTPPVLLKLQNKIIFGIVNVSINIKNKYKCILYTFDNYVANEKWRKVRQAKDQICAINASGCVWCPICQTF